jgi:RHS repeat-associated protein
MKSYDDAGNLSAPVSRTDYFYKETTYGRLNQLTTVIGGWGVPQNMFYTYDTLGQIAQIAYPTTSQADPSTGMPPCTNATCLTIDRIRGFPSYVSSSRGYAVVDSARYGDSGTLKEWTAGTGIKTSIVPDPAVGSRPQEIKVTTSGGAQLWTSGVYSYDGAGWIKSMGSDAFTYDALGRLKAVQQSGTSTGTIYNQQFSYDPFGNILSRTQSVSDPINPQQPTTVTYNIQASTNRVLGIESGTNWTYREDGALTRDDNLRYGYDNAGRLSVVKEGDEPQVERGRYTYDANGLRVYRKENHGREIFYLRDADGNVLSQFSRPVDVTSISPQWDRDFVYFDNKRINMVEEPLPGAPSWVSSQATSSQITLQWYPIGSGTAYGYLIYRRSASGSPFIPLFSGTGSVTTTNTSYTDTTVTSGTTYTYKMVAVDYAGNQGAVSAERVVTAGDSTPPPAPTNLSATPGNARVTLNWQGPSGVPDLAGYFVYRRLGSGSYGSPLNSVAVTVTNYIDLSVTNGTTYYYKVKTVDTAGLLSGWSSEVNAKPSALYGFNDLAPDSPSETQIATNGPTFPDAKEALAASGYSVIGQVAGATILFLHSDHLGSLRLVTNSQGAIVTHHKYLPYGEEVQAMSTLNPYRFAGYERDPESGKDYVRARHYSVDQARWLTPDPLGAGFQYANNTPLNASDPTGLSTTCMQWACVCVYEIDAPPRCWCHRRCYVDDGDTSTDPPEPFEVPAEFTKDHGTKDPPPKDEPPTPPEKPCPSYADRYMAHLDAYLVNVGPAAALLVGGLWPKSLAPATLGRGPFLGSGNPLTSVPRALGIPGAGSTIARTGAAGIGLATVAVGFYNIGVMASGLAYAAFPGSNALPVSPGCK